MSENRQAQAKAAQQKAAQQRARQAKLAQQKAAQQKAAQGQAPQAGLNKAQAQQQRAAQVKAQQQRAQQAKVAQAKAQTQNGAPAKAPNNLAKLAKRGILKFNISDEKTLYACYMPFVKGCGIFFPTGNAHKISDEVFLLITLPEDDKEYAASAKVIWVNPKQKLGRREPGIGLQVRGRSAESIRNSIEKLLAKKVNSPLPTATM